MMLTACIHLQHETNGCLLPEFGGKASRMRLLLRKLVRRRARKCRQQLRSAGARQQQPSLHMHSPTYARQTCAVRTTLLRDNGCGAAVLTHGHTASEAAGPQSLAVQRSEPKRRLQTPANDVSSIGATVTNCTWLATVFMQRMAQHVEARALQKSHLEFGAVISPLPLQPV